MVVSKNLRPSLVREATFGFQGRFKSGGSPPTPPDSPHRDVFSALDSLTPQSLTPPSSTISRTVSTANLQRAMSLPKELGTFAGAAATWSPNLSPTDKARAEALAGEPAGPLPEHLASVPLARNSANIAPGVAVALRRLAQRARGFGAIDVHADTNTRVITFTLPDAPGRQEIAFEIIGRPSSLETDVSFFGLRVTPAHGSYVHRQLAREARKVITDCSNSVLNGPRVAVFDADASLHLTQMDLMQIFASPGYEFNWAQAKITSRQDTVRTPEIIALEQRISAQVGHSFKFPDDRVGNAKMWCINDLRRAYFFEPLIEKAAARFVKVTTRLLDQESDAHEHTTGMPREIAPGLYHAMRRPIELESPEQPMLMSVAFMAPGSREAGSDIDCTVTIGPDPYMYALFSSIVHGSKTEPGLIVEQLREMGSDYGQFPSGSATDVFDVNFYPPGFLRDKNAPGLQSIFHVSTPSAIAVKTALDRGAAMMSLLRHAPEAVLSGAPSDDAALAQRVSVMAVDYAVLREFANTYDLCGKLVDLAGARDLPLSLRKDVDDYLDDLSETRTTPFERLRKGPMTPEERRDTMAQLDHLRAIIDRFDACGYRVFGVPLLERAHQELVTSYAVQLSDVKNQRDMALEQAIDRQLTEGATVARKNEGDIKPDYLALRATDLQIAIGASSNEAYASGSALRRTVEGKQLRIKQHPDTAVVAAAATEDTAFVAGHSVEEFAVDSPNHSFGQYLLTVAKYVERVVSHVSTLHDNDSSANGPLFTVGTRLMTFAQIRAFGTALLEAKSTGAEKAAQQMTLAVGIRSDKAMTEFCLALTYHAQAHSNAQDAAARQLRMMHTNAMRELSELASRAL